MGGLSYRSSVKEWAARNEAVKSLLARDSHQSLEQLAQRFSENGLAVSQADIVNMQSTLKQVVQFGANLSTLRDETHRQSGVAHQIQLEQGVTEENDTRKHQYQKLELFLEAIELELEELSNEFITKMGAGDITEDDLDRFNAKFLDLAQKVEEAETTDLNFIPDPEPSPKTSTSVEAMDAMSGFATQLKTALGQNLENRPLPSVDFSTAEDITAVPDNIAIAQSMGIAMTSLQRFFSVLSLSPSDNIAMNLFHKDIDATEASHVAHRMAAGRWGTDPDPRFLDPNSPIDTAAELDAYGKNMSSNPNYIPTSLTPPTRLTPDDPQ